MKTCIKCGSHAFNLYAEEIDQGGLCDVHYWQGRAHRAETQPAKGLFIDLIAQHEGLAEELAQDEQEPVHSVQSNGRHSPLLTHMMNKRTTPPKRPWVGLTDEFCITNMFDMGHYSLQIVFKSRKNADEFKAALKEKNI